MTSAAILLLAGLLGVWAFLRPMTRTTSQAVASRARPIVPPPVAPPRALPPPEAVA